MLIVRSLLFVLFLFFTSFASAATDKPLMVMLISVDGLTPEFILHKEKYGLKVPVLTEMTKEGTYVTGLKGINPTLTYPTHTTLITGVPPAQHGIYNNMEFDPFHVHQDAWIWYTEDIKAPTLWSAAKKAGLTTANVEWPVSVGAPVDYNIVQFWRDETDLDVELIKQLSTPGLIDEAEKAVGHPYPAPNWSIADDVQKADFMRYILEKKRPQFFTAYFASVDVSSHHFGRNSQETYAAIEAVDSLIGNLWKTLKDVSHNNYVLIVVSDHGFLPIHSQVRLNVAFKNAKLLTVDNHGKNVIAWKAYAWTGEGEAAIYLNSNYRTKKNFVTVQNILLKLQKAHPEAIDKIIDRKNDIAALQGLPNADFVVIVKKGFELSEDYNGKVVGEVPYYKATHGYSPELTEMDAAFFMVGNSVQAGKNLGRMNVTDVAPLIAGKLNIKLGSVDINTRLS